MGEKGTGQAICYHVLGKQTGFSQLGPYPCTMAVVLYYGRNELALHSL